jgi:hypothetical protein
MRLKAVGIALLVGMGVLLLSGTFLQTQVARDPSAEAYYVEEELMQSSLMPRVKVMAEKKSEASTNRLPEVGPITIESVIGEEKGARGVEDVGSHDHDAFFYANISNAAAETKTWDTYRNAFSGGGVHRDNRQRHGHKNFLIFFSGHQGSSFLSDMVGSIPDVFVPGFEPLEVENATAEQKIRFIELTFDLPSTQDEYLGWQQELLSLSDSSGIRLNRQQLPTFEQVAAKDAAGFKIRPYFGKRTGFRDLDLSLLKEMLERHEVSLILSTRHNTLKSAASWYRARENGLNQFHLSQSAEFDASQKIDFDLGRFQEWVQFVENTDKELLDSISFFQRPTITVDYERLEKDPINTMKHVAHFLQVDATKIASSGRFKKTGSDSLRKMIRNFEAFCDFYWQSPYRSMLGVESCRENHYDMAATATQTPPSAASASQSAMMIQGNGEEDAREAHPYSLVTYPNGTNAKDCFASGWRVSECPRLLFESKAEAVKRARMRQAPIFFKHIHKAGGSTLCSVAGANVFVEKRSLPAVDTWGTDCVPYEMFLSRPSPTLLSNALFKYTAVDSDKLTSHAGFMGGACFFGHLTTSAQHALPQAFPNLGFISSEGPLPEELALNVKFPLITMLRDPFDRIVSAYKWWKFMKSRFPGTSGAICSAYEAPANATLSEWIDYYPDNWLTRSLVGSHALYNHKHQAVSSNDLEAAKNRLGAFSSVLILEEYDTSMLVLQRLFGWTQDTGGYLAVNVSPSGRSNSAEELDDLTRQKIAGTIHLDLQLYNFALNLFKQQVDQMQIK